ncbi:achaete-scute1 [Tropilaelaps mercedesae]|uniref:Achaete-scute1 n=1 Tax=Tropilaelaps mercedesae TaxID=418985 RepID=A0A1V9X860_9ACAR|nr:achaete-scute1 [Tropilaelaps mercedesae]
MTPKSKVTAGASVKRHAPKGKCATKKTGYKRRPGSPSKCVHSMARRNKRERERVRLVNLGYATLRDRLPISATKKKLSKVETLRNAVLYICKLREMLERADLARKTGALAAGASEPSTSNGAVPGPSAVNEVVPGLLSSTSNGATSESSAFSRAAPAMRLVSELCDSTVASGGPELSGAMMPTSCISPLSANSLDSLDSLGSLWDESDLGLPSVSPASSSSTTANVVRYPLMYEENSLLLATQPTSHSSTANFPTPNVTLYSTSVTHPAISGALPMYNVPTSTAANCRHSAICPRWHASTPVSCSATPANTAWVERSSAPFPQLDNSASVLINGAATQVAAHRGHAVRTAQDVSVYPLRWENVPCVH